MVAFCVCCGQSQEKKKGSLFSDVPDDKLVDEISERKKMIQDREDHISQRVRAAACDDAVNGCVAGLPAAAAEEAKEEDGVVRLLRKDRVQAQSLDLHGDEFRPPVYPKEAGQMEFIDSVLKGMFIFSSSTDRERRFLVDAMQTERVKEQGKAIIRRGDRGDYFYIVESGLVDFIDNEGNCLGHAERGKFFGELALLYDAPRLVDCIAASPVVDLWKVDQTTFRRLVSGNACRWHHWTVEALHGSPVFRDLDRSTISRFVGAMVHVEFKAGETIYETGHRANIFYVLRHGEVRVVGDDDSEHVDQTLAKGEWFGEEALVGGEAEATRARTVTVVTDVSALAIDRETFEAIVGSLRHLLEREARKRALKSIPLFAAETSSVTDPELDQLVDLMNEVCYRKGTKLAEPGKPHDKQLWLLRHGKIIAHLDGSESLYSIGPGGYLGDAFIRGNGSLTDKGCAVCEENVTSWVLTMADIESVIGDVDRLGQPGVLQKTERPPPVRMSDLRRTGFLGRGGFGKVWLVHSSSTGQSYALKVMNKRSLVDAKQAKSVVREKELLSQLEHPFILELAGSYQDERNIYLLLPVIPGGELYGLVTKRQAWRGGLPNDQAAFYAAGIIEALGHFHQRDIAYRDLKLENVLIDEAGYCKVVDLGLAKIVWEKTFTMVGTPEYMAPEVIMLKGHDKAVDYWSFGVLVYELLAGVSPFFSKFDASHMDMFKRIVQCKYKTPARWSGTAKDFISKLLAVVPTRRLGNLFHGYLDVKNHPWFEDSGIDFKRILKKETEAPWKPDVQQPSGEETDAFNDESLSNNPYEAEGGEVTESEQSLFDGF